MTLAKGTLPSSVAASVMTYRMRQCPTSEIAVRERERERERERGSHGAVADVQLEREAYLLDQQSTATIGAGNVVEKVERLAFDCHHRAIDHVHKLPASVAQHRVCVREPTSQRRTCRSNVGFWLKLCMPAEWLVMVASAAKQYDCVLPVLSDTMSSSWLMPSHAMNDAANTSS